MNQFNDTDICDRENNNDNDNNISEAPTSTFSDTDDSEFNSPSSSLELDFNNTKLLQQVIEAIRGTKHKDKNGDERVLVPKFMYDFYQIHNQTYKMNERTIKELQGEIIRMERAKPFTNITHSQNCISYGSNNNPIQRWECPLNHNTPISRMDTDSDDETDDDTMFNFIVKDIFIYVLCMLYQLYQSEIM